MTSCPTVASTTTATSASANTVVVNRPAGAATGDLVVVAVRNQLSSNTDEPSIVGFTPAGPAWNAATVSTARRNRILTKRITSIGTEPSSYSVSVPGGGRSAVAALLVRGVHGTDAKDGDNGTYGGTKFVGGVTARGMTTEHVPTLGIVMFGADFGANVEHLPTADPSGWTQVVEMVSYASGGSDNTVARTYLWVGTRELDSFVSTDATMTWGTDQTNYAAESIALVGRIFTPPTYPVPIRFTNPDHRILRFATLPQAMSVVRSGGTFIARRGVSQDELTAAGVLGTDYFIGGSSYAVSQAVAVELEAAGFVVDTE